MTAQEVRNRLDDSDLDLSGTDDDDENDDDDHEYNPEESCSGDESLDESQQCTSGGNEAQPRPSESQTQKGGKKQKPSVQWAEGVFDPGSTEWGGNLSLGDEKQTPLQMLLKYFPKELIETFALETNIYTMTTTGTSINTTASEIRKFLGMDILMGNVKLPRVHMYWHPATRIDRIADAMPVNRFFTIRQNIHVVAARDPPENNKNKF